MELGILAVALVGLLGLNGFFVLAEFAIVRVRPSRVAELVADGNSRAPVLAGIQNHMDEYLSVCQVGITLASVALGMVGKRATDVILGAGEHSMLRYGIAIGVSYILVSGSHIVLGELVPKSIAIRIADRAALFCATPLRLSRLAFFPALWVLNHAANAILRLVGIDPKTGEEQHSEQELRIILDQSQEQGVMSFRRLLYMENVFDLGELTARDAMRPRTLVRSLDIRRPWEENLNVIKAARFSRYPLVTDNPEWPSGLVHLKDLVIRATGPAPDLTSLMRPILVVKETRPLENLLAEMQRRRIHAALITDEAGSWIGFATLEDIIEELVGTIRDEFEDEPPVRLIEALTLERIHLDVTAESPTAAVAEALSRTPSEALPLPAAQILRAVGERERLVGTYLGEGVGMPHARVPGLARPFLMVVRSARGIPYEGGRETGYLLFVLLTPAGQPRVHQRLQSTIVTLLHESEFVRDRLLTADTADEVLEVIRTGEQAALD